MPVQDRATMSIADSKPTLPDSHVQTYRQNQAYTDVLDGWDPAFYAKYAATLAAVGPGKRVIDVGCGVGQVLKRLQEAGCDAWGVDVSETSIARARQECPNVQVYQGQRLPFPDGHFAGGGAMNVLEHVEEPESFIAELVRVVQPGGRIVLSSPNFLRFFGPGYHPRMIGLRNKWANYRRLIARKRRIREDPSAVRFERIPPIIRPEFHPDDDAIIATNPLEMAHYLGLNGCEIERVECTDRVVNPLLEFLLNATPLRYGMFNAFIVARRR